MDGGDGVVGEQCVGASGEPEVVADVVGGVGRVHPGDGVAGGDALVQGGQDRELQPPAQGG